MPQISNILQNGTVAGSNKRALEAKEIIRSADVVSFLATSGYWCENNFARSKVCFDVDSTVIIDEGIDVSI